MEDSVPVASRAYLICLLVLIMARAMDFLSTWVATPNLVLEGNPLAKRLGWKWGVGVNLAIVLALAAWPLSAIIVATASVLVAARNFQSAWLMRSMGEQAYRTWYGQRLRETPLGLYLGCLAGHTLLTLLVGAVLIRFSSTRGITLLVPLGMGIGILAYGLAVIVFTLLGVWRRRGQGDPPAGSALE
ncbi:MAG TPA: hypothetical protein PKN95_01855 [Verrucomicrobiota bacterium]|nr:hypothetical protein [Verrucomicrobiota bacterium]HNT14011.1 hypothetical protein [Verrucomicrobiota bacterium]